MPEFLSGLPWVAQTRMPSLGFVLPHWLYWLVLVLFPLLAMLATRRTRHEGARPYELSLAYFIWLVGGFLGLHRFYLRNLWGLLFLPLFIGILWANAQGATARIAYSDAAILVRDAQATLQREGPRLEKARADLADLQAQENPLAARITRAERTVSRSETALEQARITLAEAQPKAETAGAQRSRASRLAFGFFIAIVALMLFDALVMPLLVRAANRRLAAEGDHEPETDRAEAANDFAHVSQGWTGVIDRMSFYAGEFVSYWAVIAVFAYFYEVVARYVFNSPTNWAHEGMFLMFGMQYLLCGAYAMLTESHVRVDIFYARFSPRGKALTNILTSVFFFIFAGVLMVTGWIFAMDATVVREISFSEWAIHYWPFKWAIFAGGLLLVLQGISGIAKDLRVLRSGTLPAGGA